MKRQRVVEREEGSQNREEEGREERGRGKREGVISSLSRNSNMPLLGVEKSPRTVNAH